MGTWILWVGHFQLNLHLESQVAQVAQTFKAQVLEYATASLYLCYEHREMAGYHKSERPSPPTAEDLPANCYSAEQHPARVSFLRRRGRRRCILLAGHPKQLYRSLLSLQQNVGAGLPLTSPLGDIGPYILSYVGTWT